MLDETGANVTAFIHRRISDTNHAHQIIGAFKWLRWAYPDDTIPQGLKKFERLLTRRGQIIDLGDARLETQPTPPQHVDKVLNDTHHGWLMEASGVTTRWKHAMCIVHSNHSMALNEEHRLLRV